MVRDKEHRFKLCVFFTCCCLFLFACRPLVEDVNGNGEYEEAIMQLDFDYELFQKNIGWVDRETLLVHKGDHQTHELFTYNIFSGESISVYEEECFILSVMLSPSSDEILFQEVNENGVTLNVMDFDGDLTDSIPINYTGYVTLDWNAVDPDLIFISHYDYDFENDTESILVQIWDISNDTLTERPIASLYPKWYTSNVYVYVDEFEGRDLFIGDMREDESDLIISRDVRDFFLNQDTFIGVVPSDINDNQVYLFHEYPFLVEDGVIVIPKVSMNNEPMKPHLTQSNRDGTILGVIADEAVTLEEKLGDYTLQKLDFENEKTEEIIGLPYDAPIALSPDESFVLYGWRYEYIIDVEKGEMYSLINSPL